MGTEFDKFYSNQTPANAVALARADHQAYSGHNASEFIDALTKAEAQCNSFEALVEAVKDIEKDINAITDRASCAPHDDPDEASKQFTIIMQRAQFAHLKIITALTQAGEGA